MTTFLCSTISILNSSDTIRLGEASIGIVKLLFTVYIGLVSVLNQGI